MHQKLLNEGYVKLIETWGSDERIIEAARMSTGGGFRGWGNDKIPGDEKLLSYLYKNKHTSPFEFGGAVFEVKAPIFVFRQWHRHRTKSYNEASARYMPLPNENWVPELRRCFPPKTRNKQARGASGRVPHEIEARDWLESLDHAYKVVEDVYQRGLKIGVPKEVARTVLPVGRYSVMRVSANLLNWFRFLTLRVDSHAQEEIRVYAKAISFMLCDEENGFRRSLKLWESDPH